MAKKDCKGKRGLVASVKDDLADEKGAISQYTRHMNNPHISPEHKKMLRHIRGEEKMHVRELKSIIKKGKI